MRRDVAVDDLVARCLDGRATDDDVRQLAVRLEADPEFRIEWLQLAIVDEALREMAEPPAGGDASLPEKAQGPASWAGAIRLHAGAGTRGDGLLKIPTSLLIGFSGIALGMVLVSAVWAFVGGDSMPARRILFEDFERASAPAVDGPPVAAGTWGGDFSELAGLQNGVAPASGDRMLRFIRDHYVGKSKQQAWSCDVHRLVDLRPYRQQSGSSEMIVRMTAKFNAAVPEGAVHERFRISGFALDAETATNGCLRNPLNLYNKSLASASSQVLGLDSDPRSWQPASAELRLPPGTDFVLVHVGVYKDPPELTAPTPFGGHYCDDVRVVLVQQAVAP